MKNSLLLCGLAAMVIGFAGCGKSGALVEGVVTRDGVPVERGAIQFFPISGEGQTAGALITDGKYSVEASVGTMKVVINAPQVVRHEKAYDTADSPVVEVLGESLPQKYNSASELQVELVAGKNATNFELTSK